MNDFHHGGAFVLQFRSATDFGAGRVEGRVEHVASGMTAHFESPTELLAVLARMWTQALRETTAPDR
jgi:hypothetical protein